jgi:hypothetical protein
MNAKEVMIKFLEDGGFRYKEIRENICFKYQMVNYVFMHNSGEELLQIVLIFYDVTDENRQAVLECANKLNQEKAMAKFTVDDDSVWINCEDLVIGENYDPNKITIMLGLMEDAMQGFYQEMSKE